MAGGDQATASQVPLQGHARDSSHPGVELSTDLFGLPAVGEVGVGGWGGGGRASEIFVLWFLIYFTDTKEI